MDPITLMMMAGGGLLGGGLFGSANSIWGDNNDYSMEGNLNKNSEAWKQYQRFSNLDSDFYQKGDERIRRTMGDLGPKANDFMTMMGSKGVSTAQALSNIKSSQTQTNEQAGQAVINLQMEGIKHAMTPLQMAYNNAGADAGQKRETQSQKTNFFNEMANMGSGLLAAGVMSNAAKTTATTAGTAGTAGFDNLGGLSGKNFGGYVNPSAEGTNSMGSLFNFGNKSSFGDIGSFMPTSKPSENNMANLFGLNYGSSNRSPFDAEAMFGNNKFPSTTFTPYIKNFMKGHR